MPKSGPLRLPLLVLSSLLTAVFLSSCEPTYPARTVPETISRLVKQELKLDVTAQVLGKTLWVYFPCGNLVDPDKLTWNSDGLESIGKVISVVHRVILSSDINLNFVETIGADTKHFGLEFLSLEYVPDLKEAVLEKISRGEYFLRSVRDVGYNPTGTADPDAVLRQFHDVTFDEFIGTQIIHRAKSYFAKDKKLESLFEIKTAAWTQKFGIFKVDVEFVKKHYDLTPQEEKIRPIDILSMIAAQVMNTYDYYKNFQAVELTDTFSNEKARLSAAELKKVKVQLPELLSD